MGPLGFHTERQPDRIVLSGELDLDAAAALREAIAALDADVLTLDLSALTFLDSSGIAALLWLRRDHPSMRLVGITPRTRELFRVVGLEDVLVDADEPPHPQGQVGE
jgi:anti-sigma B factor antagonist